MQGYVTECTGDNIFIIKDDELITPPVSSGALEGITRNTTIDIAKSLGISTCEKNITRFDLYNAQECFLTGTAVEIMPVIKIDDAQIGDEKPGKITKQIISDFKKLIA